MKCGVMGGCSLVILWRALTSLHRLSECESLHGGTLGFRRGGVDSDYHVLRRVVLMQVLRLLHQRKTNAWRY